MDVETLREELDRLWEATQAAENPEVRKAGVVLCIVRSTLSVSGLIDPLHEVATRYGETLIEAFEAKRNPIQLV